jgi:hypothetical protein
VRGIEQSSIPLKFHAIVPVAVTASYGRSVGVAENAMALRTYQQRARKFLSTAFKNDALDASETHPAKPPTYELSLNGSVEGTDSARIEAFQFTVFRPVKPHAYRLFLRKERANAADMIEPFAFMAEQRDEIVVEAIDGEEKCIAYAVLPLTTLGTVEIKFHRGTGAIKYLSTPSQPDRGDVVARCKAELALLSSQAIKTPMQPYFLPYTCIPRSIFDTRLAIPLFKLKLRDLELAFPRPPGASTSTGDSTGAFSTKVLIHNGYREIDVHETAQALLAKSSAALPVQAWSPKDVVEFPSIPLLPSSHLIVVVYHTRKGESVAAPVGVAALPLVSIDTADCNLAVKNLPVLHGPYSSPDATRCLPCADGRWFTPKQGFTLAFTAEFYGTLRSPPVPIAEASPVSAAESVPAVPQMEESGAKAALLSIKDQSEVIPKTKPAETSVKQASPTQAELQDASLVVPVQPGQPLHEISVKSKSLAPAGESSVAAVSTVEKVVVPPEMAEWNKELYRMLKELAEEVQAVKRAIEVPGAANAAAVEALADAEAARRAEAGDLEVMELHMRRVALNAATRAKLLAGATPFRHPVTDAVLLDSQAIAARTFPASALGLRFDGVTIPRSTRAFPPHVEFRLSFGVEPEAVLGPASLSLCGEDPELGQSFALIPSTSARGRGVVWQEPIAPTFTKADADLLAPYKTGPGHLFVSVVDVASGFYLGSCEVPLKAFERQGNVRHALISLDIPLRWDATTATASTGTGNQAAASERHPMTLECGIVHVTACSIGLDPAASTIPTTHHDVNGGAIRRVVEVKRLPGSAAAEGIFASSKDVDPLINKPPAGSSAHPALTHLTPEKQQLHLLRAMHVKRAMQSGLLKDVTNLARPVPGDKSAEIGVVATGGADRLELDLRMTMVEKKREELKAARIAEHLRSRILITVEAAVARGVPAVLETSFKNPYGVPMSFSVRFPKGAGGETSPATLAAHSTVSQGFALGPHEERCVKIIARHDSTSTGSVAPLEAHIVTEKGELVRIVRAVLTLTKPIITRRHIVAGDAGGIVTRTFYLRSFSPGQIGVERGNIDALLGATEAIALWPTTNHRGLTAACCVNMDPFARGYATLWETVSIEARIPQGLDDDTVLVHFYDSQHRERHVETWELRLVTCPTIAVPDVFFGQSTIQSVAIACDFCFAFGGGSTSAVPQKAVGDPSAACVNLTVRPVEIGKQSVLVHAFISGTLKRFLITYMAVYPPPTYSVDVNLTARDAAFPVVRRLAVTNSTDRAIKFTLSTNYRHLTALSQTHVQLNQGDRAYVALTVRGMVPGNLYPIFVFVNDEQDKTVESFLVRVNVSPLGVE